MHLRGRILERAHLPRGQHGLQGREQGAAVVTVE
jgi:hypothetical protein